MIKKCDTQDAKKRPLMSNGIYSVPILHDYEAYSLSTHPNQYLPIHFLVMIGMR